MENSSWHTLSLLLLYQRQNLQIILTDRSQYWDCSNSYSTISYLELETGQDGGIFTTEMDKCHKLDLILLNDQGAGLLAHLQLHYFCLFQILPNKN